MKFDLHSHSRASDGELAPVDLLNRARAHGVTHLSITDHDTVSGYADLSTPSGIELITGIELSSSWRRRGIHVLGLNIDLQSDELLAGIAEQGVRRMRRARRIADRLVKAGLPDIHDDVIAAAAGANVGRPHFAHCLVEGGYVRDVKQAFRKYLGDGRRADVRQAWPPLGDVVDWIRAAGGSAVLAHPAHYRLTRTKLRELVSDFKAAGGDGIEVISGTQDAATTRQLSDLAGDFDMSASAGSDFHRPGVRRAELGGFEPLPEQCRPIWETW